MLAHYGHGSVSHGDCQDPVRETFLVFTAISRHFSCYSHLQVNERGFWVPYPSPNTSHSLHIVPDCLHGRLFLPLCQGEQEDEEQAVHPAWQNRTR